MNKSLAHQLHELVSSYKVVINHVVSQEIDDLETEVKNIINNRENEKDSEDDKV